MLRSCSKSSVGTVYPLFEYVSLILSCLCVSVFAATHGTYQQGHLESRDLSHCMQSLGDKGYHALAEDRVLLDTGAEGNSN